MTNSSLVVFSLIHVHYVNHFLIILFLFLSLKSNDGDGGSSMCLELALEGERLCKSGDCRAGVAFFQVIIIGNMLHVRNL